MKRALLSLLSVLSLPAAALAAELSGTWHIQGPVAPNCTFVQNGNLLGGACRGTGAEGPLTGSIEGQSVHWVFTRTNFNSGLPVAPHQRLAAKGRSSEMAATVTPGSFAAASTHARCWRCRPGNVLVVARSSTQRSMSPCWH